MHNYLMIKVDYTDQKKFLPDFLKFKLNKRGVSFLGECTSRYDMRNGALRFPSKQAKHLLVIDRRSYTSLLHKSTELTIHNLAKVHF